MVQAASSQRGSRARRKDSSYGCVVRSFSQTTAAVARMNSTMGVQCCKKAFTMLHADLLYRRRCPLLSNTIPTGQKIPYTFLSLPCHCAALQSPSATCFSRVRERNFDSDLDTAAPERPIDESGSRQDWKCTIRAHRVTTTRRFRTSVLAADVGR